MRTARWGFMAGVLTSFPVTGSGQYAGCFRQEGAHHGGSRIWTTQTPWPHNPPKPFAEGFRSAYTNKVRLINNSQCGISFVSSKKLAIC
jgi:hypothetical protein